MQGQLDLKGLAEAAVGYGLGKVPVLASMVSDLTPLVQPIMQEIGIPETLEIGMVGLALGKLAVNAIQRNMRAANGNDGFEHP